MRESSAVGDHVGAVPGIPQWSPPSAGKISYAVEFRDGTRQLTGDEEPKFTLRVTDRHQWEWLLRTDAYSAAMGFLRGEYKVDGDLVAAVRFKTAHARDGLRRALFAWLARPGPQRLQSLWQSRARASRNIHFHYDRSNDFYRQFLDSRMVYSCAYFADPGFSLDRAQEAKLDLICRKLALRAGERFLDIGCGWGALVLRAAGCYGAESVGCTLSKKQTAYASALAKARGLEETARILGEDFRELRGRFHKIASVGMFEHVGRKRLRGYFEKVRGLLEDNGLFLNHGIVRPEGVGDDAQTYFLQRRVFPGGELPSLATVLQKAEQAGFEALDVENLRPHYALTCREWVRRLQERAAICTHLAGAETFRTWLLYLAGSAASFEAGTTAVYQVLFGKRGPRERRWLGRSFLLPDGRGSATR